MKSNLKPLMTGARDKTGSDEWCTPRIIKDALLRYEPDGVVYDPCSNYKSIIDAAVTSGHVGEFGEGLWEDGLLTNWALMSLGLSLSVSDLVFVNPPYSQLRKWMAKCREESALGAHVVALIPARTDTKAFQENCIPGRSCDAVCFIKGRLTFLGAPAPAPFPSALVLWNGDGERFKEATSNLGPVWVG